MWSKSAFIASDLVLNLRALSDSIVAITLGIHGQNLFLDLLAHAGLVLFQKLRFELPIPVTGYGDVHIAEAGAQSLAAVPGNGFLEQVLNVVHAANAACLQQFPYLGAALVFFRTAIPFGHKLEKKCRVPSSSGTIKKIAVG
jgi:hypothetical protein